MLGRNDLSDKELLKAVNKKLSRTGTGASSRITATVRQGNITLAGTLQYEMQRVPLIKAAQGVEGVRQVIDNLQSPPSARSRHI